MIRVGDYMKISRSISIEIGIWNTFMEEVEKKGLNHNSVIAKLVHGWSKEQQEPEYKILICDKCGSKYSEKLAQCPSCEATELEEAIQHRQEEESKDRELTEREQKVIALDTEIKTYENTLERLNDPEGHNLGPEELEENKGRVNAKLIELKAALEEARK